MPKHRWNVGNFFPETTIERIVEHTNRYLHKLRQNYGRSRDVRSIDKVEMYALLGLLYMAGAKKAQHLNVNELWSTDGTGLECMRATMSKERFLLLL